MSKDKSMKLKDVVVRNSDGSINIEKSVSLAKDGVVDIVSKNNSTTKEIEKEALAILSESNVRLHKPIIVSMVTNKLCTDKQFFGHIAKIVSIWIDENTGEDKLFSLKIGRFGGYCLNSRSIEIDKLSKNKF